jgi:ABC-type glycerol-3-phosphate transport system permease component
MIISKSDTRTTSMTKIILWFFIIGILIAVILEGLWRFAGYYTPQAYVIERVSRFLWPSSLLKMVVNENEDSWHQVILFYFVSFVGNGVVYGIVALIVTTVKRILTPPQ